MRQKPPIGTPIGDYSGAPDVWLRLAGPQRTFASDTGDVADQMGRIPAAIRQSGCNYTFGPRGRCLSFDGISGYATTTFAPTYLDFTVALWFLATSAPAPTARIIDCSYSASFWLGADGGGNPTAWGGGIMQAAPPYGTFIDLGSNGAWHHLAMTRKGTLQTVVIDGGKYVATATVSGAPLGGQAMIIGAAAGGATAVPVLFDDFRIYSYGLTLDQIRTVYTDPDRPFTAPRRAGPKLATTFGPTTAAGTVIVAASLPVGTTLPSPVTVTPVSSSGGTFSPTTYTLTNTDRTATFQLSGLTGSTTVTFTNAGGLTNPAPAVYTPVGGGGPTIGRRYIS